MPAKVYARKTSGYAGGSLFVLKGSSMKKGRFLAAVCMLALSICLIGCSNSEEKARQEAFIDAVQSGVTTWNEESAAGFSGSAEQGENLLKGVKAEAEATKNIDADAFEDKDFAKLVSEYQEAVSMEERGLVNYPNNAAAYNDGYVAGRAKVADIVSELIENYGLKFDDPRVLDSVKEPAGPMLVIGQKETIITDGGNVQIALEGFVIDQASTELARQFDGYTTNQNYSYLLCTLTNESVEPRQNSMDNWLDISSMVTVQDTDGVDLTSPNFSYEYPGYEIATGGYYEIPAIGSTKRVAIPYVTDVNASEFRVIVGGSYCFLNVQ